MYAGLHAPQLGLGPSGLVACHCALDWLQVKIYLAAVLVSQPSAPIGQMNLKTLAQPIDVADCDAALHRRLSLLGMTGVLCTGQ